MVDQTYKKPIVLIGDERIEPEPEIGPHLKGNDVCCEEHGFQHGEVLWGDGEEHIVCPRCILEECEISWVTYVGPDIGST
jgi:hypothetical protein